MSLVSLYIQPVISKEEEIMIWIFFRAVESHICQEGLRVYFQISPPSRKAINYSNISLQNLQSNPKCSRHAQKYSDNVLSFLAQYRSCVFGPFFWKSDILMDETHFGALCPTPTSPLILLIFSFWHYAKRNAPSWKAEEPNCLHFNISFMVMSLTIYSLLMYIIMMAVF